MTLYEIDSQIASAIERLFENTDEETGEVRSEDLEALDQLQIARDVKIDNIACYIKSLEAENNAIAEEEKKLRHRKQVNSNEAFRLREYLKNALGGEKFTSARNKITYRRSTQVAIFNEEVIPEEFLRVKYEPNKTAIKEAIQNGADVPGVILAENDSMIIK